MGADHQNKKNNGAGRKMLGWKILMVVCLVGVVIAVAILIHGEMESRRAARYMAELAAQTNPGQNASKPSKPADPSNGSTQTPDEPAAGKTWAELTLEEKNQKLEEAFGIKIPEKVIDFTALQEQVNPHIYAWLYIPDSTIDFPVLRHPENNSYYLNYNIDGSKGRPGCIYTENYNAMDFSDHNTVLYGHNMRNGTMFAGLHKFEDAEYFAENPYIYIYTPDEVFVYRIFGAYEFSNLHLLANYDMSTDQGFGEYLEDVMSVRSMNSNFNRDVEVTSEDRIITLSTCVFKKTDYRYLVQGVLLSVKDEPDGERVAED